MVKISLLSHFLILLLFCSCIKADDKIINNPIGDTSFYARGADIGWLSEMEKAGVKFYDANGNEQDCIDILKSKGINSIRLRVWVDPVDGWCGIDDVITQAIRAKNKGMKIMIDFHYSDWWADPGKQNKPQKWAGLNFDMLNTTLYNYTKTVLSELKKNGVDPNWVQIGNETNDGMLWEDGRASKNMANFSSLINSGYKATKEIFPSSKVIVHISNGYDNALFRWMFDGLKSNNTNYDIIAMSLYPNANNWKSLNEQCFENMKNMIERYGKEIMISEIGMDSNEAIACIDFIKDIIAKNKSLPNNKGLGVFYWEPQSYNNWKGYNMGAFTKQGKPSAAMEGFSN